MVLTYTCIIRSSLSMYNYMQVTMQQLAIDNLSIWEALKYSCLSITDLFMLFFHHQTYIYACNR